MHRIEKDWYTLMNTIINGSASEADAARKQLREELLAIAPVFGQKPYFLSDEFSLVDCYLAPAAVASAATGHRVQRRWCERAERLYDPRL
ncbi:glutathione binding-like protein [Escherichia coli]|nr:glutathione binding-like protein [Escherichia coli]